MTSSKLKTSKGSKKIHTGKRGGKYVMKNGKKVYLSALSPRKNTTTSAKKKIKYTKKRYKKKRLSWGHMPSKKELENKGIEFIGGETERKENRRRKRRKVRSILRRPAKFKQIEDPYPSRNDIEDIILEDGLKFLNKYKITDQESFQNWYNKKYLPKYQRETNAAKMKKLEYEYKVISECVQHGIYATDSKTI